MTVIFFSSSAFIPVTSIVPVSSAVPIFPSVPTLTSAANVVNDIPRIITMDSTMAKNFLTLLIFFSFSFFTFCIFCFLRRRAAEKFSSFYLLSTPLRLLIYIIREPAIRSSVPPIIYRNIPEPPAEGSS